MKSLKFILLTVLLAVSTALSAQALTKGMVTVDGYYGFPNLTTGVLKVAVRAIYDSPDLKAKGIGTFGLRGQYMVTDRIGLGIDAYYAQSSVSFTHTYTDSLIGTQNFAVTLSNPRPRVVARAEFHFGNSEVADFYGVVGLGANLAHFKVTTQDPIFDRNSLNLPGLIPVAYRVGFGTRVYPVPFLGFGAEIGIGGPLVTVGLTGKFGGGGGMR